MLNDTTPRKTVVAEANPTVRETAKQTTAIRQGLENWNLLLHSLLGKTAFDFGSSKEYVVKLNHPYCYSLSVHYIAKLLECLVRKWYYWFATRPSHGHP